MQDLAGVFDFDRVNCVIMIDDGTGSQSKNESENESPYNK